MSAANSFPGGVEELLVVAEILEEHQVSEIWRAFGLKPSKIDEFKISPDPQLVAKIRDIVGFCMNPPVNAAVFAVDGNHRSKR